MDNSSFASILHENVQLHEDMLSLLKTAAEEKKKKAAVAPENNTAPKSSLDLGGSIPASAPAPEDSMDGDGTTLEPISNSSLIDTDNAPAQRNTNGSKLYNQLAPEVSVANSVITSIYNSFVNNCDNNKKMKEYFDMVKSWEQQIRGACKQVMSIVEASNFDTTNTAICSPKAYKTLVNYNSRDRSAIDIAAAIIIFRNSLKRD
jgi:hypothetical protein